MLRAILEKKVNKNEEAMWGESHVLCISFQPNHTYVRVRYSFFTDVVTLYVLLICRINDKLRLGFLLPPHLESVMFAIRLGVMLSNSSRAQRSLDALMFRELPCSSRSSLAYCRISK